MTIPVWITQSGFLGTVTERTTTSTSVFASGQNISYSVISGEIPGGLRFSSTGTITGSPYSVGQTLSYQFVVRAKNIFGVTDRTFVLNVNGPSEPQWLTTAGFIGIGINSTKYTINNQYVDYQFSAETDKLSPGQRLRYYIEDQDGQLPPGLILNEDGRLTGQITDTLRLTYTASSSGGFDLEPYDEFPYNHVTLAGSQIGSLAKFIPKTYQFRVSVTDGIATSKRAFKIKVEDPNSFRADNTFVSIDSTQYLSDAGYLLSPQWLTPANLGIVRANNNQVIKLNVYDFNPYLGSTRYDWDTPIINQDGTPSVHPPYFYLDGSSGVLYAKLPYQPAYSETYKFTIYVIKMANQTKEETSAARTFTLTIRGDVESTIEYVTDTYLGLLIPGQQSELSIVANHIGEKYAINYKLVGGTLPTGLSLLQNGEIAGQINYDTYTSIDEHTTISSGYILNRNSKKRTSPTLIDGGNTTIDSNFYFTVEASDIYEEGIIEKEFYISVDRDYPTKFTKIYAVPFLSREQRNSYRNFLNDTYTFDRSLMYRLNDSVFGIQNTIQLVFEHGIQRIKLNDYSDELRKYFYKKRFFFGDIKYKQAKDSKGNYVYDVVYVEIIDPLQNSNGESLTGSVKINNLTVYPNSVANMRARLESVKIEGDTVLIDEYLMPRFMRTIQSDTGSPLGFILAVPICYALPGKGDTIVKRIAVSGFDFKTIDFEIDRLLVKDNLTELGTKYLLFPRKDIIGANLGEELSHIFGTEGVTLDTEDEYPLQVEF